MATSLFFKGLLLSIFVVFLPLSDEKPLSSTTKPTTSNLGLQAVCHFPQKPGDCMGFFPRWFYNHKTKQCQQFIYGGCGGNNNNFMSLAACRLTCHVSKQQVLKPIPVTTRPKPTKKMNSKETRKLKGGKKTKTLPLISSPSQKNQTTDAPKPCEIEKKKAVNTNQSGIFLPECDTDGYYHPKQCWKPLGLPRSCWCVDKNGRKTGEVRITFKGKETCDKVNKTLLAGSVCFKALKKALDASILVQGMPVPINVLGRLYVPECNLKTGLFLPRQCYKKDCWCVNINTGAEIKNTAGLKGSLKCKT